MDPSFSFIITYKFRKAVVRVGETRNGLTRGERVFSRGEGVSGKTEKTHKERELWVEAVRATKVG